jgi:CRISPR-associated protein (TIGR03984 family)
MTRKHIVESVTLETGSLKSIEDLRAWLIAQAKTNAFTWLLAHDEDGVIWGRIDESRLTTSHDASNENSHASSISPELRTDTLQQARLFGPQGELFVWRDGMANWRFRLIRVVKEGEESEFNEAIEEKYILWGTDPEPLSEEFTLMSDGAHGMRHIVPIRVEGRFDESTRPLRLQVRHYLNEDQTGFVYIAESRLVDLGMER